MSSTIYYKGTLKDDSKVEALFDVVQKQSLGFNCSIVREKDSFYIEFAEGMSEPLLFQLNDRKISWFCKWNNPGNPGEYYKIFDLFIAMKPFFKSLRVDDDEGVWHDYLERSKPCKIRLRELSGPAETALLERAFTVLNDDFSEFLKSGMMFLPYSEAVYNVIAQDFMRVLGAASVKELDRDRILELANALQPECEQYTHENLEFYFPYILLQIWIGHCLTYGSKGRVHGLSDEVRGLKMNRLAAQHGILSVFLNIHSGTVNPKHAEMKRFARDYIYTGPKSGGFSARAKEELARIIKDYIEKNNIDTTTKEPIFIPMTGEFKESYDAIFANANKRAADAKPEDIGLSFRVLVSILDYLGFRYVGAEEQDHNREG